MVLGSVGNLICVFSFMIPIIILSVLYYKARDLPSGITVEDEGFLSKCLIDLCFSVIIAICVVSIFIRKYILTRDR